MVKSEFDGDAEASGSPGTGAQAALQRMQAQVDALWGPVAFDPHDKRLESRTALATAVIQGAGTSVRSVATDGYAAPGDGGGALYRYAAAEPPHPGKVQSADGSWWEYVPINGVFNIAAFGADLTGATISSLAVQDAMDAAHAHGGGIVWHPGGTVVIGETIYGHKRITMDGIRGRSIYKRSTARKTSTMFNFSDRDLNDAGTAWRDSAAVDVTIRNLSIDIASGLGASGRELDVNSSYDYPIALDFGSSENAGFAYNNVHVYSNHIYNSHKAKAGNWTIMGVVNDGLSGFFCHHNWFDGTQLKAGTGPRIHKDIFVTDNVCRDSRAYGISCVTRESADGTLYNVHICRNIIINPVRGGIHAGMDGEGFTGGLTDSIFITGNTIISGDDAIERDSGFFFIKWTGTSSDRVVRVERNVMRRDLATAPPKISTGVIMQARADNARFYCLDNEFRGDITRHAYSFTSAGNAYLLERGNSAYGDNRGMEIKNFLRVDSRDGVMNGEGSGQARLELEATSRDMRLTMRGKRFSKGKTGTFDAAIVPVVHEGYKMVGEIADCVWESGYAGENAVREAAVAGTIDVLYRGNDFRGVAVNAFKDRVTPPSNIRDNLGFVTDARGSATIAPDANGRATIETGLSVAPAVAVLTPKGGAGHQVSYYGNSGTDIVVEVRDSVGALVTSGSFDVSWIASA